MIKQSSQIISNIQKLRKLARKKEHSILSKFTMRHEAHDSISGIIDTVSKILQIGVIDIIGNTKSAVADYISPEMIIDFLENASIDLMAGMIKNNFSSPKVMNHITEEKVMERTKAFIEARPDKIEATPSPPQVEYVEEETIVQTSIEPIKIFYEELIMKMEGKNRVPFEEVVFKATDSFGIAMYKTGQMLRVSSEVIPNVNENQIFTARITDNIKNIDKGSTDKMTEAYVERREG